MVLLSSLIRNADRPKCPCRRMKSGNRPPHRFKRVPMSHLARAVWERLYAFQHHTLLRDEVVNSRNLEQAVYVDRRLVSPSWEVTA